MSLQTHESRAVRMKKKNCHEAKCKKINFYTNVDGIENLINDSSICVKLKTRSIINHRFLPGRKYVRLQMICLNGRRNHVDMVFLARASLVNSSWGKMFGNSKLCQSDPYY